MKARDGVCPQRLAYVYQVLKKRAKLAGRAGIVGVGTLASRILGLAGDMAIAAIFTRAETDAFWVAFTIPNALRQILGEGAVSSSVTPVLSGKLAKGEEAEARAFFQRARGVSLVALAIVTVLGVLFARPLGFSEEEFYTDTDASIQTAPVVKFGAAQA